MPARITVKRIAELPDEEGITCDISPDGKRYAYSLPSKNGTRVVIDGRRGMPCEQLLGPWFDASGKVVHREFDGKKGEFHIEGVAHPAYERAHNPVFSRDGKRNAYGVRRGKSWYVVIDGKLQKEPFDSVGTDLAWSPDGTKLAYPAEKDGREFVYLDGVPGPQCMEPSRLTFSADGTKLAYLVKAGPYTQYMVLCGSYQSEKFDAPCTPGFSPTGELWYASSKVTGNGYVLGSKRVETQRHVERLFFLADGTLAARLETAGRDAFLIWNGQPERKFENFRAAFFAAPDRIALHLDKLTADEANSRVSGREVIYFDGSESEEYDAILHPQLLDAGKRCVFGARKGRQLLWVEMVSA